MNSTPDHYSLGTLPLELKHKILQLIPKAQHAHLRLVSREFCYAINTLYVNSIIGSLSNESLDLVKNSTFASFKKLQIRNLTTAALKLYSSSRCEIPYSKHVVIESGNSEQNIFKLLSHYVPFAPELTLAGPCFSNVQVESMKNKVLDLNVKSLSIEGSTHNYSEMSDNELSSFVQDFQQHQEVMKSFLSQNFNKLETLKLSPYFNDTFYVLFMPRTTNKYNQGLVKTCRTTKNSWNVKCKWFLEKNRDSIKNLILEIGSENKVFLKWMNCLVNLECLDLRVVYSSGIRFGSLTKKLHIGVEKFTHLKHLKFKCKYLWMHEENAFTHLMKNNGDTLESINICLGSYSNLACYNWLTAVPCPSLTLLNINIYESYYDVHLPFLNHKLYSLQKLRIYYQKLSRPVWRDNNRYTRLNNWILAVAPNLIELELELSHGVTMSLEDTKILLFGLIDSLIHLTFIYKNQFTILNFKRMNFPLQRFCNHSVDYNGEIIRNGLDRGNKGILPIITYRIECV